MKIRRRWRALALMALLGSMLTLAPPSADAQTANPFTDPNVFCKPSSAPPGARSSSNPGISPTSINITDMSIDTKALRAFGSDLQDFNAAFKAFFGEVNKCGGINGRTINLRVAKYNPLAADAAGHQQALCLKATEDQKAFLVIGIGAPAVARCVAIQHRSIFQNSTNNVTSADLKEAKGRIFGIYPGTDKQALAAINNGVSESFFKGKKVAVVGVSFPATAAQETQDNYVDPLEAKGVNVVDKEILPCTGTVCTSGVGSAVSRMKAKDVDVIVMTHQVSLTTAGPFLREMKSQNLRAPITGPFFSGNQGDSALPGAVRTLGSDGAKFLNDIGWYAFNVEEVYNAWRLGAAKDTPSARMCTATLARANNERQYQFNEQDISNGRWGGTAYICQYVRAVSAALWSLGNNVTTERMVAALRAQKAFDHRDTTQPLRSNMWYSDQNTSPTAGVQLRFNYPCPAPRLQPTDACFLPVDRPARVRKVDV